MGKGVWNNCQLCGDRFLGQRRTSKFCSPRCFYDDRKSRQVERFWSKVKKTNRCWLWLASVNGDGYGTRWFDGKVRSAHHVSWFIAYGVWPTQNLLHRCDTPRCVNPSCLFEGDQKANVADMLSKGRGPSKLTDVQVRKVLAQIKTGNDSQAAIARGLGVSPGTVSHIKLRKTWKRIH
jgi:hypothetical protein